MGKNEELTEDQKIDKLITFVFWLFGIAVIVLVSEAFWIPDLNKRGVLGDWIGGHLAAIAGFATILLLIKQVAMQRQELSLTREELRLTRNEMHRATEVHEAQKTQLERQAYIADLAARRSYVFQLLDNRAEQKMRIRIMATSTMKDPLGGEHEHFDTP